MVKDILLIGNPFLREVSADVSSFNESLVVQVNDLRDTLIDFQQRKKIGRGIAAPQIGVLQKIIYIKIPDRSFALINPEIIWNSDEMFSVWDSCFSFDVAFFVRIKRFRSIKLNYQNEKGLFISETFNHDLSELLQHEIDHLHGILATDHLKDNADIVLRAEWEKRFD